MRFSGSFNPCESVTTCSSKATAFFSSFAFSSCCCCGSGDCCAVAVCEVAVCATAIAADASRIMNGAIFFNIDFSSKPEPGKICPAVSDLLDGLAVNLVTKPHVCRQ